MASLGSLVIELAANTARLQSDLGKAVGIAQNAAARFTRIFGGIATLAGAGSLGAVVARSIEMGDELNKAAVKAGTTGKAMSELAYAAKQSDIDLASLSTALKKMQVSLSEAAAGGKAQIKTLSDLGLAIADIRSLKPDQQFETIADRISLIRDPADRARAATELFGKAGADLLPLFEQGAAGIRKAREEAEKLGVSFGDEQLKRLAAADDAAKRLKASWEGFAVALTEKAAPAIVFTLGLLHGKLPTAELSAQMANITYQIGALEGTKTARGLKKLAELRQKLKELGEQSRAQAPRTGTRFGAGPGREIQPPAVPVKVIASMDEWAKRQGAMTDALSVWVDKKIEDLSLNNQYAGSLGDEADSMRLIGEAAEQGAEQTSAALTTTADSMSEFARQAARNMQDSLATFLFDPFKDGLRGMLSGFVDTLRKMVAEAAAANIFKSLSGIGSGGGNKILSAIGGFFGGFKAEGGQVSSGKGYIVGERGPEWFSPGTSGFITPNGMGGGSIQNHFHIDARGAQEGVAAQIQRAIAQAAPMIVDASRRQIKDDFSRRAIR